MTLRWYNKALPRLSIRGLPCDTRDYFTNNSPLPFQILAKYVFSTYSIPGHLIATNLCTCDDSYAVVTSAKFGGNRLHGEYRFPEKTRRSENDDTPQPLDLWTNSPFIGQQVGNWSICHALCPIRKPIVHPTLYPTHISFIPSQSNFPFLKYGY